MAEKVRHSSMDGEREHLKRKQKLRQLQKGEKIEWNTYTA
jgi:hypothetical protein